MCAKSNFLNIYTAFFDWLSWIRQPASQPVSYLPFFPFINVDCCCWHGRWKFDLSRQFVLDYFCVFFIFSVRRTRPWHEYSVLFDMLGFRLIPLQNITNKYICCCFSSFFLYSSFVECNELDRCDWPDGTHKTHTHSDALARLQCACLLFFTHRRVLDYNFLFFRFVSYLFVCLWLGFACAHDERQTHGVCDRRRERERDYTCILHMKRGGAPMVGTRDDDIAHLCHCAHWTVQWNVGFFIFTHRIGAVWWRMWKNWKWRQNFCCFSCV